MSMFSPHSRTGRYCLVIFIILDLSYSLTAWMINLVHYCFLAQIWELSTSVGAPKCKTIDQITTCWPDVDSTSECFLCGQGRCKSSDRPGVPSWYCRCVRHHALQWAEVRRRCSTSLYFLTRCFTYLQQICKQTSQMRPLVTSQTSLIVASLHGPVYLI